LVNAGCIANGDAGIGEVLLMLTCFLSRPYAMRSRYIVIVGKSTPVGLRILI
jgi:hypothetical protein